MDIEKRILIFGFWVLLLTGILGAAFWWFKSEDRYHKGILVSGGFSSTQDFDHIWTDYQGAGFDFSTAVCLTLPDTNSTKQWTSVESYSEQQLKLLKLARGFSPPAGCASSRSSLLVLQSSWSNSQPNSWEVLLLDKAAGRLLLLAGTL